MSLDIVSMLTGAILVAFGVVAAALADRIRGITRAHQMPQARALRARTSHADTVLGATVGAQLRRTQADEAMDRDAVSALTNLGHSRKDAIAAVAACEGSQRGSIEALVRAAIRKADEMTRQRRAA
jgi:hypothetical protein